MKMKLATALSLSALIAGCSTFHPYTTQVVEIKSADEKARLYVNDEFLGEHAVASTFKKRGQYTLKAEKDGCKPTEMKAEKVIDRSAIWGGVLLTGSFHKFKDETITIEPDCDNKAPRGILVQDQPNDKPQVITTKTPYLTETTKTTKKSDKAQIKQPEQLVQMDQSDDKTLLPSMQAQKSLKTIEKELDLVFLKQN